MNLSDQITDWHYAHGRKLQALIIGALIIAFFYITVFIYLPLYYGSHDRYIAKYGKEVDNQLGIDMYPNFISGVADSISFAIALAIILTFVNNFINQFFLYAKNNPDRKRLYKIIVSASKTLNSTNQLQKIETLHLHLLTALQTKLTEEEKDWIEKLLETTLPIVFKKETTKTDLKKLKLQIQQLKTNLEKRLKCSFLRRIDNEL